jgi:hypothetical protein
MKWSSLKVGSVVSRKAGGKAIVKGITPSRVVLQFSKGKPFEVKWDHLKEYYTI